MEKIKLIFLDIDGVMNHQSYYTKRHKSIQYKTYVESDWRDDYGDLFCPISSKLLNDLIDNTGAKVVISSTWRHSGLIAMREMWKQRKMHGEVIDITPSFESKFSDEISVPRGCEIKWYYENKHFYNHINYRSLYSEERRKKCTLKSYVIMDDDPDFLWEQRNNFVYINDKSGLNLTGFNEQHYKRALEILNTPLKEIIYEK